ncbi:hypothetical protein N0V82_009681 [Gnomoniopsis sp. IMI 355080]|nr:hypothetical protein N0V82_009681 [Gnomoniopsis sp. IMI 355080]
MPIYASQDLQNWRLVSHAYSRIEQYPNITSTGIAVQFDGTWASTLRYNNGTFYIITAFVAVETFDPAILLFTTSDPFDDAAWANPIQIPNPAQGADPDIFFDLDNSVYVTVANGTGPWSITQYKVDLKAVTSSEPKVIWDGNGEASPEGPHIYHRDGWYWLLIANGGTQLNHSIAMARSETIDGTYVGYEGNPVLTNRGTDQYFQTVGHGDLFQDANGKWWGCALATRSGPAYLVYPMGRETVLYPVTWDQGEYPVFQPVRGTMQGWELPVPVLDPPGDGPLANTSQALDFAPGDSLPKNFVTWRAQDEVQGNFVISPEGFENTLCLRPSRVNLTGDAAFVPGQEGQSFIARKGQSHTLFNFTVDLVNYAPTQPGEEAGITAFLTQTQHFDLGIVATASSNGSSGSITKVLRLRAEASGQTAVSAPATVVRTVPASWEGAAIQLRVRTLNDTFYEFSAASAASRGDDIVLGVGSAEILSGGAGKYTGTLLGVYATSNGGNGSTSAYFGRWRYEPIAQEIAEGEFVDFSSNNVGPHTQ